jgi:hypothetical protein
VNVATPATAATDSVPLKVAPPGLLPNATVTVPVNAAVLPRASCAVTWIAGVIGSPATTALGCAENTSSVAGPGTPGPDPSLAQAAKNAANRIV